MYPGVDSLTVTLAVKISRFPPGFSFHVHMKGVLLAESATFINKLMTSDCSYKEVKHAIQTENLTAVNYLCKVIDLPI